MDKVHIMSTKANLTTIIISSGVRGEKAKGAEALPMALLIQIINDYSKQCFYINVLWS